MEDYLRVGIIATTHGIKGEVKVSPTTDDLNRFNDLKHCILDTRKEKMELDIEGVKFFKNYAILKFKQFQSIDEVVKYRGCNLLIDRQDAVELEKDEYFITDLIGLQVYEEDGKFVGNLKDVLKTGANDVFIVEDENKKELLLPYIDACILDINLSEKKITAFIMPGLRD